jgi:hypothetical protein
MTVLTVGSFHDLIKFMTLIRALRVKVHIVLKNLIYILSVRTITMD